MRKAMQDAIALVVKELRVTKRQTPNEDDLTAIARRYYQRHIDAHLEDGVLFGVMSEFARAAIEPLVNAQQTEALEMAIQQFTGYGHAAQGYSLLDLVESMGLTRKEYLAIRGELTTKLLQSDLDELDEHFK